MHPSVKILSTHDLEDLVSDVVAPEVAGGEFWVTDAGLIEPD